MLFYKYVYWCCPRSMWSTVCAGCSSICPSVCLTHRSKAATEVNELVLTNLGTHWNIRLHWFQLVPISFSLAQYPSFLQRIVGGQKFGGKFGHRHRPGESILIGLLGDSLTACQLKCCVDFECLISQRIRNLNTELKSFCEQAYSYVNVSWPHVSGDTFIESWQRKSTELLRRSVGCQ